MIPKGVHVRECPVHHASSRMPVMQQFANILSTPSHDAKPALRHSTQFVGMLFHPGPNCRIPLAGTGETQDSIHREWCYSRIPERRTITARVVMRRLTVGGSAARAATPTESAAASGQASGCQRDVEGTKVPRTIPAVPTSFWRFARSVFACRFRQLSCRDDDVPLRRLEKGLNLSHADAKRTGRPVLLTATPNPDHCSDREHGCGDDGSNH